jgi:hypothetical protein
MTNETREMSVGDWPTLAELEPVANYIAVRLADEGTSMKKVQDISNVLQYHCVRQRNGSLRIEFGLLGGWLTRSKKEFKDSNAFDVLCSVLTQYADWFEALDDDVARRELYRSLTDWLAVLTWKFKAFSAEAAGIKKKLIQDVQAHAASVQQTTEAVAALVSLSTGASLAGQCRQIADLLRQETAELPYQARLAVGLKPR